jgi:hypothetical protein
MFAVALREVGARTDRRQSHLLHICLHDVTADAKAFLLHLSIRAWRSCASLINRMIELPPGLYRIETALGDNLLA